MHFNALRSLTQPCMTAYWLYHNTYDPGISPSSANQCILGDMYLRSNLPRKLCYSCFAAHICARLCTCKVFIGGLTTCNRHTATVSQLSRSQQLLPYNAAAAIKDAPFVATWGHMGRHC